MRARLAFLPLVCLLMRPACAQFSLPSLPGTWNPAPNQGAVYRIDAKGRDVEHLEASEVGVESGIPWIELTSDANHSQTVMKLWLTPQGPRRVILQVTGKAPVEVPPGAVVGGLPVDVHGGKLLGQETLHTPAGDFRCDHWRVGEYDAWTSASIRPYGLVAARGPNLSIELEKTLRDTHSRITERPQTLQLP